VKPLSFAQLQSILTAYLVRLRLVPPAVPGRTASR